MGYLANSNDTKQIITKLTPYGKERLLTSGTDLIKYFRVGDSDANYYVSEISPKGYVPENGGTNGVASNVNIKSALNVGATSDTLKIIEEKSITIVNDKKESGLIKEDLRGEKINIKSDKGNLFKSLNLPITMSEKTLFSTRNNVGGLLKTVIGDFNADDILVYPIHNTEGNFINGKDVKVTIKSNNDVDFNFYTTFSNQIKNDDVSISDEHPIISKMFKNIVLLFSDDIKRPMGNPELSWATGHKSFKPFKLGGKQKYNFNIDEAVGFISLDLGFVVITNKNLLNLSEKAVIEYTSFSDEVYETINLKLDRNEFYMSNNSTFSSGDIPRITEFELLDENKGVIAYAKLNSPLLKRQHEQFSINVRIMV